MKKVYSLLFIVITGILCCLGISDVNAIRADVVATGSSGTCGWILYEDGGLHIGTHLTDLYNPDEPDSCILGHELVNTGLDMDDYHSIWYNYANQITRIYFNYTVYANSDSSFLFSDLNKLQTINFSNFKTTNVTNMSGMFQGCTSLENVDLSRFDTHNVTNMSSMFALTGLKSLDLSSFDTSNVTSMDVMFVLSTGLKTIKVGDSFNTNKVVEDVQRVLKMFDGCTSLVGGNGTKYSDLKTSLEYARIDTCDQEGYFTSEDSPFICKELHSISGTSAINGSINTSVNEAYAGDVITITSEPVSWYKFLKPIIYDSNNKNVTNKITFLSNTKFIMPDYNIVVGGSFVKNYNESVSNFKVYLDSYKTIKLNWVRAKNAIGYQLCYKKSNSAKYICKYNGLLTGVTFEPGIKYDFKISPYVEDRGALLDSFMVSPNAKTVSIYTLKQMSTPTVKKNSNKKVKVSFKKINGVTGYEVAYSKKKSKGYKVKNLSSSKSSIVLKVKKGKKMYYKIRAYKLENGKKVYAPWSNIKTFKLK